MKYKPTIGIETHVQLKTKTKLFAAVDNDARSAKPNTLISHICVGMPGALPVLNEEAIKLCTKAAFALNTKPQFFSKFERKHYFYPDLPKGYQITQFEDPIIIGGEVELLSGKKIAIERANLEEDAGKTSHPAGSDYSLVDLNRAGTPLLEIVSKPEIHSPEEAKAYARELYLLMKYAGVTDGDLFHGHIRFDVNVSVSKDGKLGTRSETKNLNSFRSVEAAVKYEIDRQTELIEKGQKIIQETRGWDEAKQKTISQRGKEEAEDYRYMPEPDIPPVELSKPYLDKIADDMAQLPTPIRAKLKKIGLSPAIIEDLLNVQEAIVKLDQAEKKGAGAEESKKIAFDSLEDPASLGVPTDEHLKIATLFTTGKISSNASKELLQAKVKNPKAPVNEIAKNKLQISDETTLQKVIKQVIDGNPKVVQDIKAGQDKAIGFLVGQVMQKSKGQANPQIAQKLIKKQIKL